MAAGEVLGLGQVAATLVGAEGGPGGLWQVAGAGMASANIINNLPAFLALESAAGGGDRLAALLVGVNAGPSRSEAHTSELQSLLRISYAVFCLENKNLI